MTAVRPDPSIFAPRPQAAATTSAPGARAAQADFFRMALGQGGGVQAAPPVAAQPVRAAPALAPAPLATPTRAVDPERPLRPGSLLDIRV